MSSIVLHKPAELQVMADNVYQSGMFGHKNKNQNGQIKNLMWETINNRRRKRKRKGQAKNACPSHLPSFSTINI